MSLSRDDLAAIRAQVERAETIGISFAIAEVELAYAGRAVLLTEIDRLREGIRVSLNDSPETADLIGIDVPDDMSAVEALGMLELAKDYILRDRWGEGE